MTFAIPHFLATEQRRRKNSKPCLSRASWTKRQIFAVSWSMWQNSILPER